MNKDRNHLASDSISSILLGFLSSSFGTFHPFPDELVVGADSTSESDADDEDEDVTSRVDFSPCS